MFRETLMIELRSSIFKIPGRQVVHQKIDDETIIVHLINGFYYSLIGSGALIWDWLVEGVAVAEILRRANDHFHAPEDELKQAIDSFIGQLLDEQLLVADAVAPDSEKEWRRDEDKPKVAFAVPQLVKFTDMEGILDLDPIHEVDENGWPARA